MKSIGQSSAEAEQSIAAVWRQVLGVTDVGPHDNFFDLGGTSLLLLKVHSLLTQKFGADIAVTELFQYPTIRSLATRLAPGRLPELSVPSTFDDVAARARRQRLIMAELRRNALS
jgi:acyl carrier protein